MTDLMLKATLDGVPLWMGVVNRLFSLTAIWLLLLFFLHRRRAEDLLQRAHDELETRVEARRHEPFGENHMRVTKIKECFETEQWLRTSDAVLRASQHARQPSRADLRALAGQLLTVQVEDRRRTYPATCTTASINLKDLGLQKALRRLINVFFERCGIQSTYEHEARRSLSRRK